MSRAFRCEVDEVPPDWRIERRGDAVVTWSCHDHLAKVCARLQPRTMDGLILERNTPDE